MSVEFPSDANCTIEEAVLDGKDPYDKDKFQYIGQSSHPNMVVNTALAELKRRLGNDNEKDVDAVNVGDSGDLDGGTATAVLRHKFGGTTTPDFETHEDPLKALFTEDYGGTLIAFPAAHRSYHPDPVEVLDRVQNVLEEFDATDIPIYFTDLGANEDDVDAYVEQFNRPNPILVRDHHNMVPEAVEAADEYVHDPNKCASEIVLETDHPDAPDHLKELVGIARVRDLWLSDHPKFEEYGIYGDAHFSLGDATFERLAAVYGAGILDLQGVGDEIRSQQQVKEAKIQYAVERAEFNEIESANGKTVTVASAYGNVYSSEVGRRLYTEGYREQAADLVVIAKPGGSVSMRSHADFPYAFAVANALGGGGHDCAAGWTNPASENAPIDVKAKVAMAEVAGVIRELNV